jgi:mRNA interferase MazF
MTKNMSNPIVIVVGDIVIASFPTQNPQGREQEGIRPALVVGVPQKLGIPRFPLLLVAPMTSDRSQSWALASPILYPKLVAGEAGLPQNSIILLDQIRALDLNRILRYLGSLEVERYQVIHRSLQIMLD